MAEILIVDDERVIRNGLKALLASEGYSVRTACDGDAALAAIAERRPDLVLLDIMMPRMNGFKTCEALLAARGAPVTKDELIETLRGQGFACVDTMIYMHVSNLRRKLGPAGAHITTNRNIGYSLV